MGIHVGTPTHTTVQSLVATPTSLSLSLPPAREPLVGGDLIAENQALASFDFLGTTGDSDSDEEEEEEEEEEREDEEEGDPTVSVEDEFTAGFVNAVEPSKGQIHNDIHGKPQTFVFNSVTADNQEGWELTSEISRYRESKARRGKSHQAFQRESLLGQLLYRVVFCF